MGKVILKGIIEIPFDQLESVRVCLPQHIQLTREERGCVVFDVVVRPNNPCCYDVYEEFISRAAFDAHQQRVKASRWGKVTKQVIRDYQIIEMP
ncbi:putative quinol monooxygenase [Vibrio agarivorans]|uniref:putative quinol monooxygenase n=1 Tax=Vibrio agarivorans TaxID=153622 RepID=UPI00222F2E82|nr:antibiotic biosynthesis monooxygenase [Vibrio agarivorans]MDN3660302.1 antibiotic biosynthesis monooxygenase [Vibrio agarivorans]